MEYDRENPPPVYQWSLSAPQGLLLAKSGYHRSEIEAVSGWLGSEGEAWMKILVPLGFGAVSRMSKIGMTERRLVLARHTGWRNFYMFDHKILENYMANFY